MTIYSDTIMERHASLYVPVGTDECWEWRGFRKNDYGYMAIGTNAKGDGSLHRGAHVLAWEIDNDFRVPEGRLVRHRCDNRPCCNPRHLHLGTTKSNAQDREERGRGNQARGEGAGPSRLTEAAVLEIRAMSAAGVGQRALAKRFGVNQSAISLIVNRKTWTHI